MIPVHLMMVCVCACMRDVRVCFVPVLQVEMERQKLKTEFDIISATMREVLIVLSCCHSRASDCVC